MKKFLTPCSLIFLILTSHEQSNPQKNAVLKPLTTVKVIPSKKAITIRKDVVRLSTQLTQLSDSIDITKKEIDGAIDRMKNDMDSMSEMGETESLRLQMAMDRLSKMMSTLGNLLKKISDTQQSITQNMK